MAMTAQTFFSCSLLVPLGCGIAVFAVPALSGAALIVSFAVVPYFFFASILVFLIRFSDTRRKLLWLSLAAPWLMGAFMLIFLAVLDPPELRSARRLFQLADVLPITAVIGYCYVILAWLAFFAFGRLSLIKPA